MAAFPANLLFPIAVYGIVAWKLNPDIYLSPLMILGTQWYILFNVIAGASAIPAEMRYVAANFGVTGWLWWRKVALPAVFALLCDGSHHRLRRLMECRHRRGIGHLGGYSSRGSGAGVLYRRSDDRRRFSPHRSRDRHHEFVRGGDQPAVLAPLYYYAERKYRLT